MSPITDLFDLFPVYRAHVAFMIIWNELPGPFRTFAVTSLCVALGLWTVHIVVEKST